MRKLRNGTETIEASEGMGMRGGKRFDVVQSLQSSVHVLTYTRTFSACGGRLTAHMRTCVCLPDEAGAWTWWTD